MKRMEGFVRASTIAYFNSNANRRIQDSKVPVSMIYANDVKDAKEKILALTSQYGEITDQGLYEFMNEANIDVSYLDNLRMPEIDLGKWKDNFVDETAKDNTTVEDIHLQTCPSCGFEF